jgi:hypothetical protein
MRIILAAALAASVAGAAWAAPVKSVAAVEKASAVTEQVETKEWAQAQCWVCLPWFSDKE